MTSHVVLCQVIQILKTKGQVSVMGGVSSKSKPNKDATDVVEKQSWNGQTELRADAQL